MNETSNRTQTMNILFVDSTHPSLYQELEKLGYRCDLKFNLTKEEIENCIGNYDGIVIRSKIKLTKEIIDLALKLKFIARVGAGMENIDVAYAEAKGIKCLHAPEGNRDAVGEHALAMLLNLFNNICKANAEVSNGVWLREPNRGIELSGKTVGIIGCGNMGSAFAQCLKGFNCKVIAYDKYKKNYSNEFVVESTLETLFNEADILSIHVPLTDETNYFIDNTFIQKFKKDIYIINTARGKVLKTDDLVENLKSGKVKGACLDVLEYEELSFEKISESINNKNPTFNYLSTAPNVILTPHIAGWTYESNQKMAAILVEKINALFNPK